MIAVAVVFGSLNGLSLKTTDLRFACVDVLGGRAAALATGEDKIADGDGILISSILTFSLTVTTAQYCAASSRFGDSRIEAL